MSLSPKSSLLNINYSQIYQTRKNSFLLLKQQAQKNNQARPISSNNSNSNNNNNNNNNNNKLSLFHDYSNNSIKNANPEKYKGNNYKLYNDYLKFKNTIGRQGNDCRVKRAKSTCNYSNQQLNSTNPIPKGKSDLVSRNTNISNQTQIKEINLDRYSQVVKLLGIEKQNIVNLNNKIEELTKQYKKEINDISEKLKASQKNEVSSSQKANDLEAKISHMKEKFFKFFIELMNEKNCNDTIRIKIKGFMKFQFENFQNQINNEISENSSKKNIFEPLDISEIKPTQDDSIISIQKATTPCNIRITTEDIQKANNKKLIDDSLCIFGSNNVSQADILNENEIKDNNKFQDNKENMSSVINLKEIGKENLNPEIITAISSFAFKAQKPNDLSFQKGELIIIEYMNKNEKWWFGRNKNGRGWFPYNYVDII